MMQFVCHSCVVVCPEKSLLLYLGFKKILNLYICYYKTSQFKRLRKVIKEYLNEYNQMECPDKQKTYNSETAKWEEDVKATWKEKAWKVLIMKLVLVANLHS